MKTVKEVSLLTGISVRALHHYDAIGLLKPAKVTEAGYRLYDTASLERLQQILLFRELEFPLKEIKAILESPDFDRNKALEQQISLLELKKEHLENLLAFARGIKLVGVNYMDFTAFDTGKLDEYAAQAKAAWGKTAQYREFEEKEKGRTEEESRKLGEELMELFVKFGELRKLPADSAEAQAQVKQLQGFITEHFYTCSNDMLCKLGELYAAGGEFTENIDRAGGKGTARFVREAIQAHCG